MISEENELEQPQEIIERIQKVIASNGYQYSDFVSFLRVILKNRVLCLSYLYTHSSNSKDLANGFNIEELSYDQLECYFNEYNDMQLAKFLQQEEHKKAQKPKNLGNLFGSAKSTPHGQVMGQTRRPPEIPSEIIQQQQQQQQQQQMQQLQRPQHFINVMQRQPTILNKYQIKIKIKVHSPKVISVTEFLFIKGNQLQVNISCSPLNWEVTRMESDVFLLRRLFQLWFPHHIIPPLPAKPESKFTDKLLCTSQQLVEFLMIKHANPKTFIDKLKNEEQYLLKERNILKPKLSDLSDLSDKIYLTKVKTSYNKFIKSINILALNHGQLII